jgi:carboxypeptidase PM20D1
MRETGGFDWIRELARGAVVVHDLARWINQSDNFSHGLNERIPLLNVGPGVSFYLSVLTDLASK